MIKANKHALKLKNLGIDSFKEPVIFLHRNCHISKSEGFELQKRILVSLGLKTISATINTIDSDILQETEASLSQTAWNMLNAKEGDIITLEHQPTIESLSHVRSKVYGHTLVQHKFTEIIEDVVAGNYSDPHVAMFLTACAGGKLNENEIIYLTKAMINVGKTINWKSDIVVDKHCVGGVPGNRTTLIIVPIIAAFGLVMPKTSSRAITSPAGTADTMEVLAPVNLDINKMRKVVEAENACIIWGGSVSLSPADDILIRVERIINVDSEVQLVASILSKKIAAGSTDILIDIPIGPTAKVRTNENAKMIASYLSLVASNLGVKINTMFSDGTQPVGRGIGPALEAIDVLEILQGNKDASQELRDRALTIAGSILEFSPRVSKGTGKHIATEILDSGKAWKKFQAICEAQGGMRIPKVATQKK